MSRSAHVGLGLALAALGVALAAAAGPAPDPSDPAVARGAEVAQTHCAICHAVALEDRSPEPHAPLFRVLSRLYSAETLDKELLDIAETGHFEMPPVTLREDEVADVAAYIASLDGGSTSDAPPRRGVPVAAGGEGRRWRPAP
jgi:mono/diheme cytochrome c family protein